MEYRYRDVQLFHRIILFVMYHVNALMDRTAQLGYYMSKFGRIRRTRQGAIVWYQKAEHIDCSCSRFGDIEPHVLLRIFRKSKACGEPRFNIIPELMGLYEMVTFKAVHHFRIHIGCSVLPGFRCRADLHVQAARIIGKEGIQLILCRRASGAK